MALTTPHELSTLGSWNWLKDYPANKSAFIEVAKIVFQTLSKYGYYPIGPNDILEPLTAALRVCDIFKRLCASKRHAFPVLYPVFARMLAMYIIDHEWAVIIQP